MNLFRCFTLSVLICLPQISWAAAAVPQCHVTGGSRLSEWELFSLKSDRGLGARLRAFRDNSKENPLRTFDMNKKVSTLDDLFQVVALTPVGAAKLKAIVEAFQQEEIKIKFLTKGELEKESASHEFGPKFKAAYIADEKTVYLNGETPVGLLAPHFLHELEHAKDEDLKRLKVQCETIQNKTESSQCYSRWAFRMERHGFDAQDAFINELSNYAPCFRSFIRAQGKNGEIQENMKDAQIIKEYGLDPQFLQGLGIDFQQVQPKRVPTGGNFSKRPSSH